MRRFEDRGLVERLIAHSAVAGGLRQMARLEPEAARGLLRAADFHSARAGVLIEEIRAGQGHHTPASRTR